MIAEDRDLLVAVAWCGLLSSVWFGWALGSPAPHLQIVLVVGLCLGIVVAIGFWGVTG